MEVDLHATGPVRGPDRDGLAAPFRKAVVHALDAGVQRLPVVGEHPAHELELVVVHVLRQRVLAGRIDRRHQVSTGGSG